MSALAELFRPEVRELRPYRAAQYADGCLRLNANETPWRPAGDRSAAGLNRYPEVRPLTLGARLADHYGVPAERLLVTRGSSDAIELLIRAACRPGQDQVMICPPTFGMYEVYAQVQGAQVLSVPLRAADGFALDAAAILAAWQPATKLLFLCSPNNPTGTAIAFGELASLCAALAGRGLVVLDGAYLEFADQDPTRELLGRFEHVVVLRTLSKALALAGVRCGVLLGAPEVVDMAGRMLPPYSIPTPCAEAVLAAMTPAALAEQAAHVALIRAERARLATALAGLPGIRRIWPSEANFLLVEAGAPAALVAAARARDILVRDFSWDAWTPGCLRLTVGTPDENDRLLAALAAV